MLTHSELLSDTKLNEILHILQGKNNICSKPKSKYLCTINWITKMGHLTLNCIPMYTCLTPKLEPYNKRNSKWFWWYFLTQFSTTKQTKSRTNKQKNLKTWNGSLLVDIYMGNNFLGIKLKATYPNWLESEFMIWRYLRHVGQMGSQSLWNAYSPSLFINHSISKDVVIPPILKNKTRPWPLNSLQLLITPFLCTPYSKTPWKIQISLWPLIPPPISPGPIQSAFIPSAPPRSSSRTQWPPHP